jgi:hypothetical protein
VAAVHDAAKKVRGPGQERRRFYIGGSRNGWKVGDRSGALRYHGGLRIIHASLIMVGACESGMMDSFAAELYSAVRNGGPRIRSQTRVRDSIFCDLDFSYFGQDERGSISLRWSFLVVWLRVNVLAGRSWSGVAGKRESYGSRLS